MNQRLILFSKGVLYLLGLAAIAVCTLLFPELARESFAENTGDSRPIYYFLVGVYLTVLPFFMALIQSHRLLNLISKNRAFSKAAIQAVSSIKISAILFSALVIFIALGGVFFVRSIDPRSDIAFIVILGFIFSFIPVVIAVFLAVLQRLIVEAVVMKSENDLTV